MSEHVQGVAVKGSQGERFDEILTADAIECVARLHREFDSTRRELLVARMDRQKELDRGGTHDFLSDTREVRECNWKIVPEPDALQDAASKSPARRAVRWSSTR